MITNVRESKARLSELVNRAVAGEEVVITVRGQPKAKLVPVRPDTDELDLKDWASELRRLHRKPLAGKARTPAENIVSDLREDRC